MEEALARCMLDSANAGVLPRHAGCMRGRRKRECKVVGRRACACADLTRAAVHDVLLASIP
eukprot:2786345-Rhodomonas_salina.1